jgi:hypothetical protein
MVTVVGQLGGQGLLQIATVGLELLKLGALGSSGEAGREGRIGSGAL